MSFDGNREAPLTSTPLSTALRDQLGKNPAQFFSQAMLLPGLPGKREHSALMKSHSTTSCKKGFRDRKRLEGLPSGNKSLNS